MRTTAIACALLAGTFGFSSLASAQGMYGDHHRGDRGDRGGQRQVQQQPQPQPQPQPQHEQRWEHRGDRQGWQGAQPHYGHQQRFEQRYQQPRYVYEQPRHVYQQPRYVYQQPSYRAAHRFYRGAYLPYEYRQPVYYVNNWNAYPALYAPPYGYQWMNVDGEFLLVALATGLIANALLN